MWLNRKFMMRPYFCALILACLVVMWKEIYIQLFPPLAVFIANLKCLANGFNLCVSPFNIRIDAVWCSNSAVICSHNDYSTANRFSKNQQSVRQLNWQRAITLSWQSLLQPPIIQSKCAEIVVGKQTSTLKIARSSSHRPTI